MENKNTKEGDKNNHEKHQKRGMGKDIGGISLMQRRFPEGEKQEFPGAYKPDQKVLALNRDCTEWLLAEIYKVRLSKFFDEESEDQEDSEELFETDEQY